MLSRANAAPYSTQCHAQGLPQAVFVMTWVSLHNTHEVARAHTRTHAYTHTRFTFVKNWVSLNIIALALTTRHGHKNQLLSSQTEPVGSQTQFPSRSETCSRLYSC